MCSQISCCYRDLWSRGIEGWSASLYKSLWKAVQETGMSYSSCHKAAKSLKLFLYNVHVIWHLLPPDCWKYHHCCVLICRGDPCMTSLWWHGSILHVMWSHRILAYCQWKIFLQLVKLPFTLSGLECGVHSHHGVVGPIYLENTIKSEHYVDMLYEFLGHLTEEKIARVWFYQESPACLAAQVTVWAVTIVQRSHHFERTAPSMLTGFLTARIFVRPW